MTCQIPARGSTSLINANVLFGKGTVDVLEGILMMKKILRRTFLALSTLSMFSGASVHAGVIVQCGQAVCASDFKISNNGVAAGGGQFTYDAETGAISLSTENTSGGAIVTEVGGIRWNFGNGDWVSVNSISGNADPILGFGLSASTGSTGNSYSFSFNLPIALSGTIDTASSISYSLTSTTSAGAQIKGIGGNNVLQSWDIDTSIGGLADLNKNVDVGETYFHVGGPLTTNSPVYSDADLIIGDLAYDLMAVQVAFSLSADSIVGISGFVSQTPIPLPAAAWLMSMGLGFLGAYKKKG